MLWVWPFHSFWLFNYAQLFVAMPGPLKARWEIGHTFVGSLTFNTSHIPKELYRGSDFVQPPNQREEPQFDIDDDNMPVLVHIAYRESEFDVVDVEVYDTRDPTLMPTGEEPDAAWWRFGCPEHLGF